MKYWSRSISIIFIFFLCLCSFTACSTSFNTETKEEAAEPVTRLVHYTDANINRALDEFKKDYEATKAKVDTATEDTAEEIKTEIKQIRINVESLDKELTKAVEDNKITEDVKKGYDTTIETMKTDLDKLNSDLDDKFSAQK